jgi:archaellum component FlaG (FlaF/FlaG flagellin family)
MADGGASDMIMLVTSLIIAGVVSAVLIQAWGGVSSALDDSTNQIEANSKTEATLISDPMNIDWNPTTNQTMITVQNTGETTLNITGTTVLLNGSFMNVTQRGVIPSVWIPGSVVNFTLQGNILLPTNEEVFLNVIVQSDRYIPARGVNSFTEVVRIV